MTWFVAWLNGVMGVRPSSAACRFITAFHA